MTQMNADFKTLSCERMTYRSLLKTTLAKDGKSVTPKTLHIGLVRLRTAPTNFLVRKSYEVYLGVIHGGFTEIFLIVGGH